MSRFMLKRWHYEVNFSLLFPSDSTPTYTHGLSEAISKDKLKMNILFSKNVPWRDLDNKNERNYNLIRQTYLASSVLH